MFAVAVGNLRVILKLLNWQVESQVLWSIYNPKTKINNILQRSHHSTKEFIKLIYKSLNNYISRFQINFFFCLFLTKIIIFNTRQVLDGQVSIILYVRFSNYWNIHASASLPWNGKISYQEYIINIHLCIKIGKPTPEQVLKSRRIFYNRQIGDNCVYFGLFGWPFLISDIILTFQPM